MKEHEEHEETEQQPDCILYGLHKKRKHKRKEYVYDDSSSNNKEEDGVEPEHQNNSGDVCI